MRKFTSLIVFSVFVVFAFAQERTAIQMGKLETDFGLSKSIDTIAPMSFFTGELTYYITVEEGTVDTGYVCGTNWYGDEAKAQMFIYDEPYNLLGCLVWIVDRKGTSGNLQFKVYKANGPGIAYPEDDVNYAPGTVLATVSKSLSQVNSGLSGEQGFNYFALNSPLAINFDYYVGLDFTKMGAFPANKVGIASTTDGDAKGTDLAWEDWGDGFWVSMYAGWELDFDMMFLPVISSSGADIQEHFINNVIMNFYPNPTSDVATIEYELKNNANDVQVVLHDLTGKAVAEYNLGAQNAGKYTTQVDVSNLSSGTYIYSISADKNRLAKKFTVK